MVFKYTYDELLKRAVSKLPKDVLEKKRFEVPKVTGMVEGNKTIVTNFIQIADFISRPTEHLLKFFANELGTSNMIENKRVVFIGKFSSSLLNTKLNKYIEEFVICPECKKPDTKLIKEDRVTFLKCSACGARRAVRSIK